MIQSVFLKLYVGWFGRNRGIHFGNDFYGTNSFENYSWENGMCVTLLYPFLTGSYKNECYLEEKSWRENFKIAQPAFDRQLKDYLFI